ncbi:MAG TPA: DEAD/DEAH box helicase [Pyrinomonadaceae bacterium]|jgi:Superfamily II DNA/RNA helicases, SNF2 family|nr:DEAD/DEAH box helicase [Pyrinomonadaceae bacterium]
MSLKAKFSNDFKPQIRDRGHAYFRSNAVKILSHSESLIEARVTGSANYRVRLKLGSASLDIACTCPYFDRGEECKHVWATMLAADSEQYLSRVDLLPKLHLRFDEETVTKLHEAARSDRRYATNSPKPKPEPLWKRQLSLVTNNSRTKQIQRSIGWSDERSIYYVVDPSDSSGDYLGLEIGFRERKTNGEWSKIKSNRIQKSAIGTLRDAKDREILAILSGASGGMFPNYDYNSLPTRFTISTDLQQLILPLMCSTGRCVVRSTEKKEDLRAVKWDDGDPWQFWLNVTRDDVKDDYTIRAVLRRDEEQVEVDSAVLITEGILITNDLRASMFDSKSARAWKMLMRDGGGLNVPADESPALIAQLAESSGDFKLSLPEELQFKRTRGTPLPHLIVRKPQYSHWANSQLEAEVVFDYGSLKLNASDPREGVYEANERLFLERDRDAETGALTLLSKLGFKRVSDYENKLGLLLPPKKLPAAVRALIDDGWKVEAEGKLYRNPGSASLSVSSGIDWFELHGSLDFGDGLQVKLPALLSALRRGETMIALGDGSLGLLPQEWLQKYGLLTSLGEVEDDHLRFKQTQTGVLDALLAARPEITCDETFAHVRAEWQNFRGISPVAEPPGFVGTLRDYQREGLGWFEFLQRFNFGGCLADDMGLGKTVQVLALLESRRNAGTAGVPTRLNGSTGSSLVVVPRSLIFNWQQEAARFTPNLRLLVHSGADRTKATSHFENYDLILTTYGTLRRDVVHFQDFDFDFVILDEAQAIKNARTESAKAARLLKGKNRLALSGTPVENHLGELWSLFEFLNPGMLGSASVFQLTTTTARTLDEETRQLLSRALRPFLLRRTKQQVAKDLPEKLEQTIYCEMEDAQRRHYNELRDYYRASLLKEIESVGIKRAKIQILEALLRLRQAACHPGLIKASKDVEEPSAKLDLLMPQLSEVIDEGHKALVFSQFTSFLSIVRQRLDSEGIAYEYLDGKTRDRQAPVERFQNDPDCKLFLISLKAGGQGLNLTAAEYVFLLDPWWNPAVESQAIDRAHRIGQTRRVFAYRLITRDTVEEKVLELQSTKRELADAIVNADNSVLRNITSDDLKLLLS